MRKLLLKGLIVFALAALPRAAAAEEMPARMEYLDRGLAAVRQEGGGAFLSWRLLGTEAYDTAFDIYCDGEYVKTVTDRTSCAVEKTGEGYAVVPSGQAVCAADYGSAWDTQYLTVPLDVPEGGISLDGEAYTYSPNDVTPADADGDGEYELILKWEPSNSFDSGKDAKHTGNVYVDCYKLSGERLWRIDLGVNISAGAHFTQIAAYDFDLDGRAELAMKTAPGSVDGCGRYVTEASLSEDIRSADNSADYRDAAGRVLAGDEYYTVFRADTGEALDTVYYPHPRGSVYEWGDGWGNRSERYLSAAAYLDGKTPSMIAWRGYYAKTTATAFSLIDGRLVMTADFDSGFYPECAGQGNHNLTVADVDGDGCDELLCGSLVLDNDLSPLWCSGRGHGDALHIGDYDPTHEGMEYFSVHESAPYGMTLYDAATGEELFHADGRRDTGRGMMANVGYSDGYFELWGAGSYASYGGNDVRQSAYFPPSTNQRIFWDGDTFDELLDGASEHDGNIEIAGKGMTAKIFRNVLTNNYTKNDPCLIADILGDWREEFAARSADNSSLIIYTTVIPTEHKLYTLMHDRSYRMQVACQNAGYNQPPHIDYYLSEDKRDGREDADFVCTVHDGVTAVRSAGQPAPTPAPAPTPEPTAAPAEREKAAPALAPAEADAEISDITVPDTYDESYYIAAYGPTGGKTTADIKCYEQKENACVLYAAYDSDGRLKKAEIQRLDLTAGQRGKYKFSYNGALYKVFILDKSTLQPYTRAKENTRQKSG